jgi:hypothetical protein
VQDRHQVLLPRLAEGQAVQREIGLDPGEADLVDAEGVGQNVPLDLGIAWEYPVWTQP